MRKVIVRISVVTLHDSDVRAEKFELPQLVVQNELEMLDEEVSVFVDEVKEVFNVIKRD